MRSSRLGSRGSLFELDVGSFCIEELGSSLSNLKDRHFSQMHERLSVRKTRDHRSPSLREK